MSYLWGQLVVWSYVKQRFALLVDDLQLTDNQKADGHTKAFNISKCLQRNYYGETDVPPPGVLVGSWGKHTQVRPPRDLDMFFILPWEVKQRFDNRVGNIQSQLLAEVKAVLAESYPQTNMRGDGQVVQIAFNTIMVEVVPVFSLYNGQYTMPDTNDGGSWKTVDPGAQIERISTYDNILSGNVRKMSQLMKLWKHEKSVPIKSFILELLVSEFQLAYSHGSYDTYWYDYYARDFLAFLIGKANGWVIIPGTSEFYALGDDWLSRAQTAYGYAQAACAAEINDDQILAGTEWQKIFGSRIKTSW